jgi:hypothetical protein
LRLPNRPPPFCLKQRLFSFTYLTKALLKFENFNKALFL